MSNMTMNLDILPLRDKLATRVFGHIVARFNPNTNPKVNASALESLGVSYDFLKRQLERRPKNILSPILQTALESIDMAAEIYVMDHNCVHKTTEERFNAGIAMEDASDMAFEEEDGDITSGVIADMIEDLSKKHSTEIKDLAKYILKLEKEKQDDDRAMAEEEDKDYVQEDDETENEDQNSENGTENPFDDGENTEEDEQKSGEDEQNADTDDTNPFDDNSGNQSSGDENTDNEGNSNPFNEGKQDNKEEDQNDQSENKENPFAEGSTNESGNDDSSNSDNDNSGSNLNSDNPFESYMADISKGHYNGNVFKLIGIESGDIISYVNHTVSLEYKNDMQKIYEEFGMESDQFKSKQKEYVKVSETAIESICASIATMYGLGLPIDLGCIKYYQ